MNKAFSILLLLSVFSPISADEQMTIGIIDFYGIRSLTEEQVRAALPVSEGIVVSDDYAFPDEKARSAIAEALGVFRVELSPTCCYEPHKLIVYVGIEEEQTLSLQYRDEPAGDKELPATILETARQLETAMIAAIQKGDSREDRSQGHSLMMNSEARALQQKYIEYAEKYRDTLIEVLYGSAQQRALAATVLAYSADKKSVIPHLEAAVLDPEVIVRNDASRALALIAGYANENPELDIRIDATIFVDMLNSVAFDDRNKSAAVLLNLTNSRDPHVIEQIRAKALPPLIEMCQWEWGGHAWTPCKILERTLGLPDRKELHPKDESIGAALELLRLQAAE
jgi:hypothetical protein